MLYEVITILDIEDEDKQTPTAETSQKSTHTREELNAKLQEAIANEDYELASRIRDELKNLSE